MAADYVLQARDLWKLFPGVQALAGVQLDLAPGQVHAVMGENGAGKSTLMRVLAGLDTPDRGEIRFKGRPVQLRHPQAARRLGISMIHQELMTFPNLTVAENILMGQEPASRWLGWLDKRAMQREAQRLLDELGVALLPTQAMRELSVAQMQAVEIARATAYRAEVIIMDEPTSALSAHEVEALFALIGDLAKQGVAVVYISHRLDEVFRIADRVTVLRDGRHVAAHDLHELDPARLIALMVGREAGAAVPAPSAAKGAVALAARGLGRKGKFQEVSFEVRQGEVLGLAGLMGAGRTDLLHAIFGLAPADAGELRVQGRSVRIASPRDALRYGIGLVSEDRQEYGLAPLLSVKQNLTLASLRCCCRGWFINPAQENRVADEQMRNYAIKAAGRDAPVNHLSGGNQQKVVIAKALLPAPAILLLDEPTRGIDIAAKAEVHAIISRLAQQGKAVVLVSSELPELLALSDRLLVLCEGRITAELDPRRSAPAEVMKWAMPPSTVHHQP